MLNPTREISLSAGGCAGIARRPNYNVPMSLGTRLTLKTAVLVLAVVVVAAAALWGLGGLNRDLDAALGEYDRLREVYSLSNDLSLSLGLVRFATDQPERLEQSLMRARLQTDALEGLADTDRLDDIRLAIREAQSTLKQGDFDENSLVTLRSPINRALSYLSSEIESTARSIESIERGAEDQRARVQFLVTITAIGAALLAIVVGIWQYLAVMRPLNHLQRGVKRLSSGDFTETLRATGDREFVALADDFNRMANELSTLYRDLEEKVRMRSAQLAQSERLASVGFLAAGVAHEINNPLAIIAGEAELALGALTDDAGVELRRSLETTRDEAFRCKAITQKLLSLASPGSGAREPVDVFALAQEVASLVRSLPQHEGRAVHIAGDASARSQTVASQVKQVLLNLVINALEAVEPGTGRIDLQVGRVDDRVAIHVRDNGKGLDSDTLKRVFQPFYTEKKSPTTPGLGLGLSISHAIIEDLGGRLSASSDGPGKGSTFTIELPPQ